MKEPITDAQWAAGRALAEGEPQTHARIAATMGVHTTTVSHRAAEDGWKTLDYRHERIRIAQRGVQALATAIRAEEKGEDPDERTRDALVQAGLRPPSFGTGVAGKDEGGTGKAATGTSAAGIEPPENAQVGQRIARIGAILTRQTEAILMRAEAGYPIETRQVAALSTLVQLSERIAVLAAEELRQEKRRGGDELGNMLKQIDDRIITLATAEARRLLIDKFGIPRAEVDAKLPEWSPDDEEEDDERHHEARQRMG